MRFLDNFQKHRKSAGDSSFSSESSENRQRSEAGFSLVEVVAAMTIFLIAMLGVFVTFTYAVSYNAGNNSRIQALSVLQQEVEQIRSKKFIPGLNKTDSELLGGKKPSKIVESANKNKFKVDITVDDDPNTPGIQEVATTKFKEIHITVTLDRPTPGWQTSVPATVVLRRVRGN